MWKEKGEALGCDQNSTTLVRDGDGRIRRCPGCGRFQVELGNGVLMANLDGLRELHRAVREGLRRLSRVSSDSWRSGAGIGAPETGGGGIRSTLIQVGEGVGLRYAPEELIRLDGLLSWVLGGGAEA